MLQKIYHILKKGLGQIPINGEDIGKSQSFQSQKSATSFLQQDKCYKNYDAEKEFFCKLGNLMFPLVVKQNKICCSLCEQETAFCKKQANAAPVLGDNWVKYFF